MKTVLFDLDGTLADIKHRRRFLEQDKPDWKAFNDSMSADTPNGPIVSLYKILWHSNDIELIILTGRHEKYRSITESWLKSHDIDFLQLIMRPDKDFRTDHIVKEEMLKTLQVQEREILFVVDDRNQVVDMWRRNGITCLQCDYGDF